MASVNFDGESMTLALIFYNQYFMIGVLFVTTYIK